MAKPHTTDPQVNGYTNPEVKFERSDIASKSAVQFGVGLGVLVVGTMVAMGLLLRYISGLEKARKVSDLPAAAVDQSQGLPPIPLEGIEDIRDGRPRLFPPRAAEDAAPRQAQLREGDAGKGVLPIGSAMKQYAEGLADGGAKGKGQEAAAPTTFTIRLPSKAASGRVETGGQ